jgi:uncharacterized protein YjbI with pentapeptide repeats
LREAKLEKAIIKGAKIHGACFDRCDLFEIHFDETQFAHGGQVGPNVHALERLARGCKRVTMQAQLLLNGDLIEVEVEQERYPSGRDLNWKWVGEFGSAGVSGSARSERSITNVLIKTANALGQGQLDPLSVKVSGSAGAESRKELIRVARGAFCEVFGVVPPTDEEVERETLSRKENFRRKRDELLAALRGGTSGVQEWNTRKTEVTLVGDFRRVDLSGAKLKGARFIALDLRRACFDSADLKGALFYWRLGLSGWIRSNLADASFKDADLRKASLGGSQCPGACFDGAHLNNAKLRTCILRKATFRNADLTGADCYAADMCGADLSSAKLNGAEMDRVVYNHQTRFPKGFRLHPGMKKKG